MSEWRRHGFVQDSDDEQDSSPDITSRAQSSGLQSSTHSQHDELDASGGTIVAGVEDAGSDTKTSLELQNTDVSHDADLLDGGTSAAGVRDESNHARDETSIRPDLSMDDNEHDSELDTTPHSDHIAVPNHAVPQTCNIWDIPSSPLSSPKEIYSDGEMNSDQNEETQHHDSGGRTFRPRNPIQLHPYILEQENYRASLKARGLRPVILAHNSGMGNDNNGAEESQWQDRTPQLSNVSSDSEISDELQNGSRPLSRSPTGLNPTFVQQVGEEDDLLDLNTLLSRPIQHGLSRGHKRLKTKHGRSRGDEIYRSRAIGMEMNNDISGQEPIQEVSKPSTPPDTVEAQWTGKKMKMPRIKKFRLPRGQTPAPLPTPRPSSETDMDENRVMSLEEDPVIIDEETLDSSDSNSEIVPSAIDDWRNSMSQSSTSREASPDPDHHPHVSRSPNQDEERNKISIPWKGVLPASWGRLEQQVMKAKAANQRIRKEPRAPATSVPLRGVAKKVIRKVGFADHQPLLADLSDDSDAPISLPDQPNHLRSSSQEAHRHVPQQHTIPLYDSVDIEEEDWIDPMLPSTQRNRRRISSTKKQQLRLLDSFNRGFRSQQHSLNRNPSINGQQVHVVAKGRRHRQPLKQYDENRQEKQAYSPSETQTRQPSHKAAVRGLSSFSEKIPSNKSRHRKRQTTLQVIHVGRRSEHSPRPENTQGRRTDNGQPKPRGQYSSEYHWPGQLQDMEENPEPRTRSSDFRRRLLNINDDYDQRRLYQQRSANPLIERLLSPEHGSRHTEKHGRSRDSGDSHTRGPHVRQISVQNHQLLTPDDEPIFEASGSPLRERPVRAPHYIGAQPELPNKPKLVQKSILEGFDSNHDTYTTDFEIQPFPVGTFFDNATFLGSGELERALRTRERCLKIGSEPSVHNREESAREWSLWTENVLADIRQDFMAVFHAQAEALDPHNPMEDAQSCPTNLQGNVSKLRHIITYFATKISFSDPIDINGCVNGMLPILQDALENLDMMQRSERSISSSDDWPVDNIIKRMLLVVLVFQITALATGSSASGEQRRGINQVLRTSSTNMIKVVLDNVSSEISTLATRINRVDNSELAIYGNNPSAEALVVLYHVLPAAAISGLTFWNLWDGLMSERHNAGPQDTHRLEECWHDLFSVLPLLRIDVKGIAMNVKHPDESGDHWKVPKWMLQRLFDLQGEGEISQQSGLNSYIRVNLGRCMTLITNWGWTNSELVLGCVFDFFARRGFALLPQETRTRLVTFLEELDDEPKLDVMEGDRSFDIFLKMLAISLKHLRSLHSSKRMKNLIWRFIPNHGRRHVKEADLREDDLEAIRNQHHLLCVLYWTSPSSHRINVERIRTLVDVQTSHSELSRISIRSWIDLMRFQISADEDVSELEPFASWFNGLLQDLVHLHKQARIEGEASFTEVVQKYPNTSRSDLERVIDRNEREIEGLLVMLLAGLTSLTSTARSTAAAKFMFENSEISTVFRSFDIKSRKQARLIGSALEVYEAYFMLSVSHKKPSEESQQDTEESQDYGNWFDTDEIPGVVKQTPQMPAGDERAIKDVQQILSSCFGAETFDNEQILRKVVEVWICACHSLVRRGYKSWIDFTDRDSSNSWYQLRETDQRHKFHPYFTALAITTDRYAYHSNPLAILEVWFCSLVERDCVLKYQHLLTNALLNSDDSHDLLQNLPFSKDQAHDKYAISLEEIRRRRLSLISSILENMRRSLHATASEWPTKAQELRQDYAGIIKQVSAEMKRIYGQTQQGNSVRGTYVEFVQRVVGFFQQFTTDILPIDKFFTDSTAFPLPTEDPTYVVARLKSYAGSLGNERAQKKLITFVQAVSERAAVDNQQEYLIDQLAASVAGTFEDSSQSLVSLRSFLLAALFPMYIDKAFSTHCGWILALPILRASMSIFQAFTCHFNLSDRNVKASLTHTITIFLQPIQEAIKKIVADRTQLKQAWVSSILRYMFETATATLRFVDFLDRSACNENAATSQLHYIASVARHMTDLVRDRRCSKVIEPKPNLTENAVDEEWKTIADFCSRELEETLNKNWIKHNDEYFVIRGNTRRPIIVDLSTAEKELEDLVCTMEAFLCEYDRLPAFRDV